MEYKTFLGKYRVARDEIALAAPAVADDAVVTETATPVSEAPAAGARYRGVEIDSGRDVTVEVIPAFSLKRSVREQLEAEALAAKKINHINVPALYDFGVEDDHLIYVTEHFDGTSAEEWVNAHGPMPTGAVFRIALQVIGAMGVASIHKISHHAINPGNLILVPGQTPEGDWPLVKVAHFVGVAPTFSIADTSVASFDKSSHYASPEQLRDGTVDFRSEIYSLGATMWFLLTGAPPLTTPRGPAAGAPATVGSAADKLSGMPKKVRRLLAQMLSADPNARPQEPLAFYRQIQDCLAQVDRRETMARRFGVPALSAAIKLPSRRRFPTKALTLAAVLLILGIIAILAVPAYLRHQRIRQAEEPIGVPVGVTEPVVAAAPQVPASAPTVAPAPPQPEQPSNPVQVAQTSPIENPIKPLPTAAEQTAPAVVAEQNQPPPVPNSTAVVAAKSQPSPNTLVAVDKTKEKEPPPPTTANTPAIAAAPPQPEQTSQVAIENRNSGIETAPAPKVAANEVKPATTVTSAPSKSEPAHPRMKEPESDRDRDTEIASNVPTPRAVHPEVRRAEPAPAEGPEEEVAANSEPEQQPATTRTKRSEERIEPARAKTDRIARAKRPTEKEREAANRVRVVDESEEVEAPMPRSRDGRMRARFIGVTPEGNWMFSLPSKKIVVLPPPPGG